MEFKTATEFLYSRQKFGIKLGLDNIRLVLKELGNPEKKFYSVLIAGTNGKGSVSAMIESGLRACDIRTGLFTSPHLVDIRERIRIDGQMIKKQLFCQIVGELEHLILGNKLTFFESMTTIALYCFYIKDINVAILEVGMGGRLDATNSADADISVITDIHFDHVEQLGNTKEKIAYEKAGIIKRDRICVVGKLSLPVYSLISKICHDRNSDLLNSRVIGAIQNLKFLPTGSEFEFKQPGEPIRKITVPLAGPHQVGNSLVALSVCALFRKRSSRVLVDSIITGIKNVKWPGRFEILTQSPLIIYDVAHNPSSFSKLDWMLRHFFRGHYIILIMGLLSTKDVDQIMDNIHSANEIYFIPVGHIHSIDLNILYNRIKNKGNTSIKPCSSLSGAMSLVLKNFYPEKFLICVAGSHYMAEDIYNFTKNLT